MIQAILLQTIRLVISFVMPVILPGKTGCLNLMSGNIMKSMKFIVLFSLVTGFSVLATQNTSMASSNGSGKIAPMSAEKLAYCSRRHRSFNPRTGYFKAQDGRKVFCIVQTGYIKKANSHPWPPYPRSGKTFKQWQDCVFGAAGGREGYSASDCDNQ